MHSQKTEQLIDAIEKPLTENENGLVVYKIFLDKKQALELAHLLEVNHIAFSLVDNSFSVDTSFTGDNYHRNFQILLRKQDFEKASALLEQEAEQELATIQPDHYLYSFSDAELKEVLIKKNEWSSLDVKLAAKILSDRGIVIDPRELKQLRQEHLEEIATPATISYIYIIVGYISAFLGGFFGLFIGWYLWKSKRTLPNGDRVFYFDKDQQFQGKIICFISFFTTPAFVLWYIYIQILRTYYY